MTTAVRKEKEAELGSLFGSENYGAGESVVDEGAHRFDGQGPANSATLLGPGGFAVSAAGAPIEQDWLRLGVLQHALVVFDGYPQG